VTIPLNGQDCHLANRLRFGRGSTHFSTDFGELYSVTPVNLIGEGHSPHLEIRSSYGLRLDVSAKWLAELVRRAPEALAKLPVIPDMHDAVGGE
jgi:hypothetical protein